MISLSKNLISEKFDSVYINFFNSPKTMTLSLQITSPKFLDKSFTTQMDLVSGKVFYHSKLGEYLDMLPWQVAEEIQRAIWRYKFSSKVLVIPKPLYFDWDNDTICHQPIQKYIKRRLTHQQDQLVEVRQMGDNWHRSITDGTTYPDRLMRSIEQLKKMTPQDVLNADPDKYSHGDECKQLKYEINKIRSITPEISQMNLNVDYEDVCHCFNKDGCMCGTSVNFIKTFKIPMELTTKYEFICHKVGRGFVPDNSRSLDTIDRKACALKCCFKHRDKLDIMSVKEVDEYLEDHLAQHGYIQRNGYWCDISSNDACRFTTDKRTKKGKCVLWEKIKVRQTRHMMEVGNFGGGHIIKNTRQRDEYGNSVYHYPEIYFPKLSKRLEKNKDKLKYNYFSG